MTFLFLNDVISHARNLLHSGSVVKYGSFFGATLFKTEECISFLPACNASSRLVSWFAADEAI